MNQSTDINALIVEYTNKGHSLNSIANILGLNYSSVRRRADKLRLQNRLPHRIPLNQLKRDVTFGRIGDVLNDLNDEDQLWLLSSTPGDMTLAEFLATIVKEKIHGSK